MTPMPPSPSLFALVYAATVAPFLILDLLWLGIVAKSFYRRELGSLLAPKFRFGIALAFYLLYVVGLVTFAALPGVLARSAVVAAVSGALFGFFCYATYNLTNWSTLRDWPGRLSLVDMTWGTVLSGASAAAGAAIALRFLV